MAQRGQRRHRDLVQRGPIRGRAVAGRPGRRGVRGAYEGALPSGRPPDGQPVVLWDEPTPPGAGERPPPVTKD